MVADDPRRRRPPSRRTPCRSVCAARQAGAIPKRRLLRERSRPRRPAPARRSVSARGAGSPRGWPRRARGRRPSQRDPGGGGQEAEQGALREELPHQPTAAGADGGADADLLARTTPRASSRLATLPQAMRRTSVTPPRVTNSLSRLSPMITSGTSWRWIPRPCVPRVLGERVPGDPVHLGLRERQGQARLEETHHGQVVLIVMALRSG